MLETGNGGAGGRQAVRIDALVSGVLAGANRPADLAETLPAAAYTAPSFFDLEVERIFRQDWFCVGHVSQLAEVGDYFTLDLFGELLVVVRAADRIRVLSRVCLHRWAPVVTGEGRAKLFSCPFHKWGYALDGSLLGAPFMEAARDFQATDCRLPEIRSEIVEPLGLIFISFAEPVDSITERLQSFSDRYRNWRMADLVAVRPRELETKPEEPWRRNHFNWKIQVETFMECYHHIGAHPETFEIDQPARLSSCETGGKGWTICHSPYRDSVDDAGCTFGLPLIPGLAADERRICDYVLIYPCTLFSIRADTVGIMLLIPVSPTLTLSRSFTLVAPEAAAQPGLIQEKFGALRDFFNKTNEEDNTVNEMQQAGAGASLASIGRLSHLELTVAHLADYVRGRIGSNT
jgi:phenylpropionate dioxygenase-like ring-hydroxylating dioxygenase large terminal subunit